MPWTFRFRTLPELWSSRKYTVCGIAPLMLAPPARFANSLICAGVQPVGQMVRRSLRPAELTIEFGFGEFTPPSKVLFHSVTLAKKPGAKVGAKSTPTDQASPVCGLMFRKP